MINSFHFFRDLIVFLCTQFYHLYQDLSLLWEEAKEKLRAETLKENQSAMIENSQTQNIINNLFSGPQNVI